MAEENGLLPVYSVDIVIYKLPKCDVNPQPNTRGIGPLVDRTSGNPVIARFGGNF